MKVVVDFKVVAQNGSGQDRIRVSQADGGTLLILADGAGGMGGGDVAAEKIVQTNLEFYQSTSSELARRLRLLDRELCESHYAGESTAIIIAIDGAELTGASVGDSHAWLVVGSAIHELTEDQSRKPFVGSGTARPIGFSTSLNGGRLLIASDGLFNYAKRRDILRVLSEQPLNATTNTLVDLVRLKNGKLQDDVSIIVCDFESGT